MLGENQGKDTYMDIVAGDKVLMEFSTFGDRYLSIVTDVKEDGRLLVFSPISAVVVERLQTDPKAVVKYAHEGRLLGFTTRVLNRVNEPGSILELARPVNSFDAEERSEVRCSCRFPATVVEGDRAAQAVIEDISASYSRVRFLNGGFEPGEGDEQRVRLTFHPFDTEADGYSVGCCVRQSFMRDGKRYAVLEFDSNEKSVRKRIASFIEAQVCCGIPRL